MGGHSMDGSPRLKIDVMFEGIRYSDALGAAAAHAFPNYYPYRFKPGEPNPTGESKVTIPYLLTTRDGTLIRIRGDAESGWYVAGDAERGYRLYHDTESSDMHSGPDDSGLPIAFEPLPEWMKNTTSDGFAMAQAGISLHGDMAVVNVAPGCEYFLHKHDGQSMRCTFCSYGAPDERTAHLGQKAGQVEVPGITLQRMHETLQAALAESEIRHIYLVGGSLIDPQLEGERFLQLARATRAVSGDVPVTLGSAALPESMLDQFHSERLVDNVCFNLEVWSEAMFRSVCPGKHRYVGYDQWLASLEYAVGLWGRGHVYTAMVAGVELEPVHEMNWEEAAQFTIRGADDLCRRGIIPVYSLYWPVAGRDHPEYFSRLRNYFETLNLSYRDLRQRHGLGIRDEFMCHRCAYMQLECDLDRSPGIAGAVA